ncbi:hypothetical protein [Mucisphaera sp.]|uniref:hypothetical protein n=1 Tax=Mucisphaera sp. TaxID=2913024 RepID=UPI003D113C6B
MHLDHLRQLWRPAISSGYAREQDWTTWADQMILKHDEPPIWIIELANAKDRGVHKVMGTIEFSSYAFDHESIDESKLEALLGYFWLTFTAERCSFEDCIHRSHALVDRISQRLNKASYWDRYESPVTALWIYITEPENYPPPRLSDCQNLYHPWHTLAQTQWNELQVAAS